MNRRGLLFAGAAGVSALLIWPQIGYHDEDSIVMVVKKKLDYLKLDMDGVKQFAKDMAILHTVSSSRLRVLSGIKPVYSHFNLSAGDNSLSNLLRHGEDRIVSSFLISSDFFLSGSDESKTVKYLGMLDSRRACANPFARPPAI